MSERELAIRNLDRDSNALRLIRRALYRIAHGTYGVCLTAKKISCQNAWPPCHGRPSVSGVRNRSIAARFKLMKCRGTKKLLRNKGETRSHANIDRIPDQAECEEVGGEVWNHDCSERGLNRFL